MTGFIIGNDLSVQWPQKDTFSPYLYQLTATVYVLGMGKATMSKRGCTLLPIGVLLSGHSSKLRFIAS